MALPTAPVTAGSMLGSYLIASRLGARRAAVATMVAPLAWSARRWQAERGTGVAAALTGVHLGAFGLSHPAAKRVGAWPAVLGATALTGAASHALADRRG